MRSESAATVKPAEGWRISSEFRGGFNRGGRKACQNGSQLFSGRQEIMGGTPLKCPDCPDSDGLRPSRFRLHDWPARLIGLWPWRCLDCNGRFYRRQKSRLHFRKVEGK
jgi:hypothetical protein